MKNNFLMSTVLFIAAMLLFACQNPTGTDKTYTVTYHLNGATGGNVPSDPSAYAEKSSVTILGNPGSLVKDGYPFFVGWNTKADGSGSLYREGESLLMPGSDLTLYADFINVSKLLSSDGAAGDIFGVSVAVSGDYAIVGASGEDISTNSGQGAAYVFMRTGTNTWDAGTKIVAPGGAAGDRFGCSVAISGDCAIVGASWADISTNSDQGAAYVFRRTGTNNWDAGTKIVASDGAANDRFGESVAVSGDCAIVGAFWADISTNSDQGAAYVFRRTGTNTWDAGTKITASDGSANYDFGTSVAVSGDYAIVGASGADISGPDKGAAYVFRRTGTNTWDGGTKIVASDGTGRDYFGDSVAVSGNYAIVGAPGALISENQGAAYVFRRTGTNTWDAGTKITASDGAANDWFGDSVAISGDYAIVGANHAAISGNTNQGAAYIKYVK